MSPLSCRNDSVKIESKRFGNNIIETILIPQKFFHDADVTSKQRKHRDKAPIAPIRPQSYYVMKTPTTMSTTTVTTAAIPTDPQHHQLLEMASNTMIVVSSSPSNGNVENI